MNKHNPWLQLLFIQIVLLCVSVFGFIYAIPHWQAYSNEKLHVSFRYPSEWYLRDDVNTYGFIIVSPDPIQEGKYSERHIRLVLNKCTNNDTGETYPCEKTVEERTDFFKQMYPKSFKQKSVLIYNKKITQIEGGYPAEGGRRYQKDTVFPDHSYLLVVSTGSRVKEVTDIYNKIIKTVYIY